MAEEQQRGALEGQILQVLSELRHQREEVSALREEVQSNNFNVSTEVKKLRTDKDIVWKYSVNKVQFDFNSDTDEIVKQAQWALEHGKSDYCSELLKDVSDKFRKRNKLIRIADSSAGGWETVKLYNANPIASDSEDEAKIYKAENRALKRKRSSSRGRPASATVSSYSAAANYPGPNTAPVSVQATRPAFQQTFPVKSFRGFSGVAAGPHYAANRPVPGACFACGSFSHFRKDCPHVNRPFVADSDSSKK